MPSIREIVEQNLIVAVEWFFEVTKDPTLGDVEEARAAMEKAFGEYKQVKEALGEHYYEAEP